jgi:Domain of unknown function (DUF4123)
VPPPPDLIEAIGALPPERYAVVDGARFRDLPRDLKAALLSSRPLYLEGADVAALAAGPHLVRLKNYEEASRLLRLVGDRPAAVFWSWPGEPEGLYRHLRRLNVVNVARVHAPVGPGDYETLLFRHADPNVLGIMVEVMDPAQRRELMGQSPGLAYFAPKIGTTKILRGAAYAQVQ